MLAKVSMVGNAGKNRRRYECDAYINRDMIVLLSQMRRQLLRADTTAVLKAEQLSCEGVLLNTMK